MSMRVLEGDRGCLPYRPWDCREPKTHFLDVATWKMVRTVGSRAHPCLVHQLSLSEGCLVSTPDEKGRADWNIGMFGCSNSTCTTRPEASAGICWIGITVHDIISASTAVSYSMAIFWRQTWASSRETYRWSIRLSAVSKLSLLSGCSGTSGWSEEGFTHRTRMELIITTDEPPLRLRDDVHWPEFGKSLKLSEEKGA